MSIKSIRNRSIALANYAMDAEGSNGLSSDGLTEYLQANLSEHERMQVSAEMWNAYSASLLKGIASQRITASCQGDMFEAPGAFPIDGKYVKTINATLIHVMKHMDNIETNMRRVVEAAGRELETMGKIKDRMIATDAATVGDVIKLAVDESSAA